MFVIGNLLNATATVLDFAVQALVIVLFVNAVLSWVRPDPGHPVVRLLERISDLACAPVRRLVPTSVSGIDFAPFIVMVVLWGLGRLFLVPTLHDLANRL